MPSPKPDKRGLAVQLYQWCLYLYPRTFRQEYGEAMSRLFADLVRDERRNGRPTQWLAFWLDTGRDIIASAWTEHLTEWRNNMSRKQIIPSFLGVLLLAYSFSFAAFNLLKYNLGLAIPWEPFAFVTDNPQPTLFQAVLNGLIVFGPALAFGLFALPLISLHFDWQSEQFVTVTMRKGGRLSLILLGLCLLVGGIFLLYLIGENLACLIGQQVSC